MSVPSLPPELWARIANCLKPDTLSALSQVNRTLHKLCTELHLFQNLLPTSTNPVQHYRRGCALSYPPPSHTSIRLTSALRILCTFNQNLLLHDVTNARLIAFPTGVAVDVVRLVGDPPVTHEGLLARCVLLPGSNIAFVSCITRVRLTIWNVITGDVTVQNLLGGLRAISNHIIPNRFAAVAGDNAESVIYYRDDDNVAIVEWDTGKLVREFPASLVTGPLLFGECPAVPGMTVVGLVSETGDGLTREIICKPFSGPTKTFSFIRLFSRKHCHSALRSLDKQTFVVILSTWSDVRERTTEFIAKRMRHDLGDIFWQGALPMYARPELVENGRVITSAYGFEDCMRDCHDSTNNPLFEVTLFDDGTTKKLGRWKRNGLNLPVWHLRMINEAFAVTVERKKGLVELIKIKGDFNDVCVKSWSIKERIVDAAVVADHFIVATCEHKRLFVWHFDKFCDGARGIFACPGLIPDVFLQ